MIERVALSSHRKILCRHGYLPIKCVCNEVVLNAYTAISYLYFRYYMHSIAMLTNSVYD